MAIAALQHERAHASPVTGVAVGTGAATLEAESGVVLVRIVTRGAESTARARLRARRETSGDDETRGERTDARRVAARVP